MTTTHTEVVCPNCDETHDGPEQLFIHRRGRITCISCTEPEEVGAVAWHKAMETWCSHRDIMHILAEHDLGTREDVLELVFKHGSIEHGIAAHTLYEWMGY